MFDESDLLNLKICELAGNSCLVCVWVTNNDDLISFVKDTLFPAWRVNFVDHWIWLKVIMLVVDDIYQLNTKI